MHMIFDLVDSYHFAWLFCDVTVALITAGKPGQEGTRSGPHHVTDGTK
jgi:hypothetical protein